VILGLNMERNREFKTLNFGQDSREAIGVGVSKLAAAVKVTLGPRGRNVVIKESNRPPHITKDGVTVAKSISLRNPEENVGAQMIKDVAGRTADVAGDGPQPLYSKVLTPTGFKAMGEIKVGDAICGTAKSTQTVLGIYPKGEKEICEVVFSDGRKVECCTNHLFSVTTNYGKSETLTVEEMIKSGRVNMISKDGQNRYGYYVPVSVAEFANEEALELDPYLLGLLIGDGCLTAKGRTGIEIAIGSAKRHVLDKIVLPEGISFTTTDYPDENYTKIRLIGMDKLGRSMKDYIRELGLIGLKSNDKFIPKHYLYSSTADRVKLMQGLLDTDGHVNLRGKFEYSTVSERLKNDFIELCRGLGIQINSWTNESRVGGYSNTPVFRVTELMGYTYGIKITDIRRTGRRTEMQCIKVSNDDHLYFTDDYVLTHNTTSATILAEAIFAEGMKLVVARHDPMSIKRGIDKAVEQVVEALKLQSREVESNDDIRKVATVSANGEVEIGDIIAKAMLEVGNDGVITLEEGTGFESELHVSQGFEWDRGFLSAYFMTQEEVNAGRNRCVMEGAKVWIVDGKLSTVQDMTSMLPTLEICMRDNLPVVIIAEDISGPVLNTLAVNAAKGLLQCVAIKSPGYGASRKEMIEDLAIISGATVRDPSQFESVVKDVELSELGSIRRIEVSKEKSVLIGAPGQESAIQKQCEVIRAMVKDSDSSWTTEQLNKRLAKLTGGVATLAVGAPTEVAMREKRDRFEDALAATRAAVAEGVVAGGGVSLVRASKVLDTYTTGNPEEDFGVNIIKIAVREPLRQILKNAGQSDQVIISKLMESEDPQFGYNAATNEYANMFDAGVIDPTKVSRVALQNAADVAGLLLTTECLICVDEED